jgi:hypothetical protein
MSSAGIILFHPRRHPTTSYYTSITISSLGCGLLLGYMWLGPLNPAYRPHLPVHRMPHPLLSAILRCVLGSLALFGMKVHPERCFISYARAARENDFV